MAKYILKEDGNKQLFNEEKIKKSLLKAGTKEEVAAYVINVINSHLEKVSESKDIYRLVLQQLKKKQPTAAMKYSLKKAIMDMGPAGYVFEKYIAKILKEYGYRTQVGLIIKGYCVDHEIDVTAQKNDKHYMVECKYHNKKGAKSDIQTALYVYARFLDLKKANTGDNHNYSFQQVWLATNTKCTTEVIKYASCVKMKIIAWAYPEKKNLEYYIENKKLYPISILTGLKKAQKEKLFGRNIITVKDLLRNTPQSIEEIASMESSSVEKLFAKAAMIIH